MVGVNGYSRGHAIQAARLAHARMHSVVESTDDRRRVRGVSEQPQAYFYEPTGAAFVPPINKKRARKSKVFLLVFVSL
jgi:hypothetical protein